MSNPIDPGDPDLPYGNDNNGPPPISIQEVDMRHQPKAIQEPVSQKKKKKRIVVASTSLDEERWIGRQRIFLVAIVIIVFMALLDMASDYNMYREVNVRKPFFMLPLDFFNLLFVCGDEKGFENCFGNNYEGSQAQPSLV